MSYMCGRNSCYSDKALTRQLLMSMKTFFKNDLLTETFHLVLGSKLTLLSKCVLLSIFQS